MKVFIDVGAYDGDTLEKAMALYPDCDRFYAFEPYPPNFAKLCQKYGQRPEVILSNQAAATADGTSKLFLHQSLHHQAGADEGGTLESSKNNIDHHQFVEVPTVDLARFIKDTFTPDDELILKLDIEGAEYDILEQMVANQSIDYIDNLYCEWHQHKTNITIERHQALIKKLATAGLPVTGDNRFDEFSQSKNATTFSIVIATFNRRGILKQLLDSLYQQTDKDFEVIVAIDGSSDGTADMLTDYRPTAPFELRWIDTNLPNTYGLATARNMGIKAARGPIVAILDDDSFPTSEFVSEHRKTVTTKTLTGGARLSTDPNDNLDQKNQAYLETYGDSTPQKFKPVVNFKWVVENNTCMFKPDWLASGLFDETIRAYGGIGQKFNQELIKREYQYQFNPRAAIVHHAEYRQNKSYPRLKTKTINVYFKNTLKRLAPPLYNLAKKVKQHLEYHRV